ncbi:uncharacterized protein [Amphiura filiformis]|uniref:uncharacterized protein n=1 Tax=Amphiura filiformis TaxID=82378 RepID=UPI003B21DC92
MVSRQKILICLGGTVIVAGILFIGGVAGWFMAKNEDRLRDISTFTVNLVKSQVKKAEVKLQTLLSDVLNETGIQDAFEDVSWLQDPRYYTIPLITHTEEQEKEYLEKYGDIFFPRAKFDLLNSSGQVESVTGGRKRRATGFSRICPARIPGPTHLVTFTDGFTGEIVQLNENVQWVFNEECHSSTCSSVTSTGCTCSKVRRQEVAMVYVFDENGQLSSTPLQKTVYVHSCVATV